MQIKHLKYYLRDDYTAQNVCQGYITFTRHNQFAFVICIDFRLELCTCI